jgi:NTE family protein
MSKPKIGLALGSGASRGFAHIGVLKALQEEKISIDMIAGTSAGALIGALYCSGADLIIFEKIVSEIQRKDLLDVSVPKVGLIKGNKITDLIRLLTKGMNIEDLHIPFSAVATDLVKGEKIVINSGPVYKAVRASISIPGIFIPVYTEDKILVDGAIVDRVPVTTVREMGADIVIGVDVGFSAPKGRVEGIFDILFQSLDIIERELLRNRITDADILIKPYLPNIDPYKFDHAAECSNEGYAITKAAIPQILKIIDDKGAN